MMAKCYCEDLSRSWEIAYGGDGSYTDMTVCHNQDGSLVITAHGEGSASFIPNYCPFCGKKLGDGVFGQYEIDGRFNPLYVGLKYPKEIWTIVEEDLDDVP